MGSSVYALFIFCVQENKGHITFTTPMDRVFSNVSGGQKLCIPNLSYSPAHYVNDGLFIVSPCTIVCKIK